MDRLVLVLGSAGDFASLHPFASAWMALTTAWTVFTFARRET